MSRRFLGAAILSLAALPLATKAQQPPIPGHGPAPLLFVRFSGPQGAHVAFYQGQVPARDLPAPVKVGLRPGYIYRVRIQGMSDYPNVTLYPSLEVRGTLELPPKLNAAEYPAPVTLTDSDIRQVLAGTLVTKVIYLEHPERATPMATKPGQALETDLPAGRDVLDEARTLGRPVAILRLGERTYNREELEAESTLGTILLPGDRSLPPPTRPPWLPWACFRVYDPFLGRRFPEEECLHDGGDVGLPAGIDANGRLGGLDPSDSIAEYTDTAGRRRIVKSNRVCICVPRYAVLRTETPPAGASTVYAPAGAEKICARAQISLHMPSFETEQTTPLLALHGHLRASGTQNREGLVVLNRVCVLHAEVVEMGVGAFLGTKGIAKLTEIQRTELRRGLEIVQQFGRAEGPVSLASSKTTAVLGRMEGVNVLATVAETRDLTVACNEEPHPPEKPLVLYKWASACAAQVGDAITFYLKYSNHGGQPITDVAVNDSLTGRLEYIPGTARSDCDAVFTTQENEAGSVILRWEIGGKLQPGTSGVVSFQARVR
jgi:uncharacterized repeat protein (TIGR01451 family)